MSQHIQNPEWRPHHDLGFSDADWDNLKAAVTDYLKTQSSTSTVAVDDIRAIDSQLADDRTWAQLSGDMELFPLGS